MIVGIVVAVMALFLLALGGYLLWRRSRTPPELRGDWWQSFEREFRAYAEHAASRDSERRRQRQRRSRPPMN